MAARLSSHRGAPQRRDVTINLRTSPSLRALIDRAAQSIGQNRSEFMLDSARRRAEGVLLDQRLFLFDAKQYDRFVALLDAPPKPNAALRRLLATKAPWER